MTRPNQAGRRALRYQTIQPTPKPLGVTVGYLKPVMYDELVARFGEPLVIPPPEEADGRIQVLWRVQWEDGTINEIYDYKVGPFWLGPREGIPYQQLEEWNVSGEPEGYGRLSRMFGVPPRRGRNPAERRPNLAVEILEALMPAVVTSAAMVALRPRAAEVPLPEAVAFSDDLDLLVEAAEPDSGKIASVQATINFDVEVKGKPLKMTNKLFSDALEVISNATYRRGTLPVADDASAMLAFSEQDNEREGELEGVFILYGTYTSSVEVDARTVERQVATAMAKAIGKITKTEEPESDMYTLSVHGEAPMGKKKIGFISAVPWMQFDPPWLPAARPPFKANTSRVRALKRNLLR